MLKFLLEVLHCHQVGTSYHDLFVLGLFSIFRNVCTNSSMVDPLFLSRNQHHAIATYVDFVTAASDARPQSFESSKCSLYVCGHLTRTSY